MRYLNTEISWIYMYVNKYMLVWDDLDGLAIDLSVKQTNTVLSQIMA